MSPPAPVTLVVGEEELLVARAVEAAVAAVRATDPDAEVHSAAAGELTPGELAEMLAPSLFAGRRVVVVYGVEAAGKDLAAALQRHVAAPPPDVNLVLTTSGKGSRSLLAALRAGAAAVVEAPRPRGQRGRAEFVVAELRRAGRQPRPDGVDAILDAVGGDLRELATACAQLVSDTSGPIGAETVRRYHRGRAEASGFAVADRAMDGDVAGALELLRWALLGPPHTPVLVTSALATNLRTVAAVAAAGRADVAGVARVVGLPTWKADKALRWARQWEPAALAAAVAATARADAEVKGAAADPGYALERLVLAVAGGVRRRGRPEG